MIQLFANNEAALINLPEGASIIHHDSQSIKVLLNVEDLSEQDLLFIESRKGLLLSVNFDQPPIPTKDHHAKPGLDENQWVLEFDLTRL